MEYLSHSPEETEAFGCRLAQSLTGGTVIACRGGLGMGKTALTRGIAKGLGYEGRVTSPTFTIVNEYRGGAVPVFHFDMYRIESEDDLYSIGFYDYLDNGFCLCEWSENIEFALPSEYIKLEITRSTDPDEVNTRSVRASLICEG